MNRLFGQLLFHKDSCVLCDCSISSLSLHFFDDVVQLFETAPLGNSIGHRILFIGSKIDIIISQNLHMSNGVLEEMSSNSLFSVLKPSSNIREIHYFGVFWVLDRVLSRFVGFHSENACTLTVFSEISEDISTVLERFIFFPHFLFGSLFKEWKRFKNLEYFCKILEGYTVPNRSVLQILHNNLSFLNLLNTFRHLSYYITYFLCLQVYF